jgi:MSHA biogenesis protein MshQ
MVRWHRFLRGGGLGRQLRALVGLLLAGLVWAAPAAAADYVFPDNMPNGCSGSGGIYTCGNLNLAYGDTISIAAPRPARIEVRGGMRTDGGNRINTAGVAGDLTLAVSGRLETGFDTRITANISADRFLDSGGQSIFIGTLSATGDVVLGYATTLTGSISTAAGDISLGNSARVSGDITGGSGNVSLDYAAQASGSITTGSGSITLGQIAKVAACARSTGSARIDLGFQSTAGGVCCGGTCTNSCVRNSSTYAMPGACATLIAKYDFEETSWNRTAGELKDTAGYAGGPYNGQARGSPSPSPASAAPARSGNPGTCGYATLPGPVSNGGGFQVSGLPVSTAAGAKTSVAFWMYWNGVTNVMPIGWQAHDLWFNGATFGFNTASSDVFGISTTGLAGVWRHVAAIFTNGSVTGNKIYIDGVSQTLTQRSSSPNASNAIVSSTLNIGGWGRDSSYRFAGRIDQLRVFKGALSDSEVAALVAETRSCSASTGPDHYELSLPTSSLSCSASTVTVTACADASSPCTNPATNLAGRTATLTTSGATLAATTVTFDANGVARTTLSYPTATDGTAVSVTLSGEQTAATNPRKCCPDGVSCAVASSCSTTFNTAGFIFSASANGASAVLPTQTAGTGSGTLYLRAVKSATTTRACEAALTGATIVNWAAQCNNPATCADGNSMTLTGNAAGTIAVNPATGITTTTAVPMTFDANGNAPFSFNYADVGLVTLRASKSASGSLLSSLSATSNAFVVKPAGFTVSGIKCTSYAAGACATVAIASPGNNPGAASSGGAAFIPAGQPFSATVTAVNAAGVATPNYGRETTPAGVTLTHSLVLPAGGNVGVLANPGSFGAFSAGVATGTSFNWSEVGIITLTPSVAGGNYLGAGNVTGTPSGNVGRFIPSHFDTVVAQACPAGNFSYSGQPFTVRVTAMNGLASPTTTTNYGATTFARAVALTDGNSLAGGSLTGAAVAASLFSAGVASTSTPVFTFASATTAPGTVTLRATDTDGVSSLRLVAASSVEGSTQIRSGRLKLQNAYGSERLALQVPATLQYWNGGWRTHTADSCTSLAAARFSWSFPAGTAARPNNLAACMSAATISGVAPSFVLNLGAPGAGNTGWADLSANLGASASGGTCTTVNAGTGFTAAATAAGVPWLKHNWTGSIGNPAARVTFGVFKAPIIYRRENY